MHWEAKGGRNQRAVATPTLRGGKEGGVDRGNVKPQGADRKKSLKVEDPVGESIRNRQVPQSKTGGARKDKPADTGRGGGTTSSINDIGGWEIGTCYKSEGQELEKKPVSQKFKKDRAE